MIHLDLPFITISSNDADRCVEVVLKDFAEGKPYRSALLEAIALLKKKGYTRYLADMRQGAVIGLEDTQWLTEEWTRAAQKVGLKKIALIMPQKALSAMQLNRLTKGGPGQTTKALEMETTMFATLEEARSWLRSA